MSVDIGKKDFTEFVWSVVRVMTLADFFDSIRLAIYNRKPGEVPVKIVFGALEWMLFAAQLMFPFIVLASLIFIPICY